jgi:hypothetical protein
MLRTFVVWITFAVLTSTINGQPVDKLPRWVEYKGDIVKFTHRPLSPKEIEIYDRLLEQVTNLKFLEAKDPREFEQNLRIRMRAISELSQSPHVRLIKPLANFIRKLQLYHDQLMSKYGWRGMLGGEVGILTKCADEGVIDLLIEFLGHPLREVRATALEDLQKILRLPDGYRQGQLSWVSLEDANKRKEVVKFLSDWWQKNKGKIQIYWVNAWRIH